MHQKSGHSSELATYEDISDMESMGHPDSRELNNNVKINVGQSGVVNCVDDNVSIVNADVIDTVVQNIKLEGEGVNEAGEGDLDMDDGVVILHTDNVKIPKLTNGQRITLAYDYVEIPVRETQNDRDEDELCDGDADRLHVSFPKCDLVDKMFDNYVALFEKPSAKNLTGEQLPASNLYSIKPGFQISPHMESWAFKSHGQDFPQGVDFDGNIGDIKGRINDPLPSSIFLKKEEYSNLQKAASYQLRAISHAEWYRKSTKNALDMALQNLDPETSAPIVKILQDCKQFIKGISYSNNLLTRMGVYVHGGVTSTLRHDFLQKQGMNIPSEEKACLFSMPYGKSLVFQGLVSDVSQKVKEHKSQQMANRHLQTTIRLADSISHTHPAGGAAGGLGRGAGKGRNFTPGGGAGRPNNGLNGTSNKSAPGPFKKHANTANPQHQPPIRGPQQPQSGSGGPRNNQGGGSFQKGPNGGKKKGN